MKILTALLILSALKAEYRGPVVPGKPQQVQLTVDFRARLNMSAGMSINTRHLVGDFYRLDYEAFRGTETFRAAYILEAPQANERLAFVEFGEVPRLHTPRTVTAYAWPLDRDPVVARR